MSAGLAIGSINLVPAGINVLLWALGLIPADALPRLLLISGGALVACVLIGAAGELLTDLASARWRGPSLVYASSVEQSASQANGGVSESEGRTTR